MSMTDLNATRTLVKSPPELWAELSEVECLTRHLGKFGEIRITRTDPQSTVAWEGEHASGTVELEESGWGTKVTLTAAVAEPPPEPAASVPEIARPRSPRQPSLLSRLLRRPAVAPEMPEPVMAAAIHDGALTVVEKGRVPRRPEGASGSAGPALDVQGALNVLETTLESLGQAHHRPFSRG